MAARLPPRVALALCVVPPGVFLVEAAVAPPLPVFDTFVATVPRALPGATAVGDRLRPLPPPPTFADAKCLIRR